MSEQLQVGPIAFPNFNSAQPRLYDGQRSRSQLSLDSKFLQSTTSLSEKVEDDLTEDQLRELYDNEEVDRFLHLFSAFVTEVRAPDTPLSAEEDVTEFVSEGTTSVEISRSSEDEGEWTQISSDKESLPVSMPTTSNPMKYDSISEEIAYRYLLPILPPAMPSTPVFTIGRLRLAVQRLYLVALPGYVPFIQRLISLATWENHNTSLLYCSIYWILWWQNLLVPSLVLHILFTLLKRRIFPYPSLQDLRQHREEVLRADEFGERVSAKLSASSSGVMEIWRLFKLLDKTKKNSLKGKAREITRDKGATSEFEGRNSTDLTEEDATVLDDADDSKESKDMKRIALQILEDIAELHERVRNTFIWRRPASSRNYAFVLFLIFLATLLPTRYIAKLTFFILGVLYWHIVPIIASLPPSDRSRLPPPLCDVPSDAEYAMELISQRVAAGLPINPAKSSKNSKKRSMESLEVPDDASASKAVQTRSRDNSIDWKKWGGRVAIGKSVINDIRRLKPGSAWPVHETWPPRHPIIPGIVGMAQPRSDVDARTYPCQHSSGPGLITLTHSALLFTPLMSQSPKLTIRLAAVKGVKKSGLLKGLQIRWNDCLEDGTKESKEDKFVWVGERDEVFARLVGSDGKRWMKVAEFLYHRESFGVMFFTPELLSKRDSGFGLLWLAATLGSRSAFKKLPKRSVLTADISQLCDLISEPEEPLALRLSSNLMFGVVRVYKVKQEIFMTDVTNCVNTLKKVVQELRISGDSQLQMANPTVRPAALTMIPDSREAYALDYDAFVANWDEYLNMEAEAIKWSDSILEDDDPDFDPTQSKRKNRPQASQKAAPTEAVRKEAHTLEEHHEHILSASFDMSFSNNVGQGPSSSQAEAGFDNFFPFSDGLDIGEGLGDDLARELGWATSPIKSVRSNRNAANIEHERLDLQFHNGGDLHMGMDFDLNMGDMGIFLDEPARVVTEDRQGTPGAQQASKTGKVTPRKENAVPTSRMGSVLSKQPGASPATSFSRLLLSQDDEQPLRDITGQEANRQNQQDPSKKAKRTRLLLDARTELTDDELKIARAKYLESQQRLRREMLNKKYEKNSGKFIEELIWSAPRGLQEQGLRNFWQENFKVQVEARSGVLRIHHNTHEPPVKRRKMVMSPIAEEEVPRTTSRHDELEQQEVGWDMDWGVGNEVDMAMVVNDVIANRHSSEEPGQARRISRSASVLGANNLAFDLGPRGSGHGSQRSSLFPWDNAGPSSSSGNVPFAQPEVEHVVEQVDVRLRSSSISRRGSPLVGGPSRRGSAPASNIWVSPGVSGRASQIFGEDFAFEVDEPVVQEETQQETQKSELNLITLERNSFNFLEYAKMQYQTLSKPDGRLQFETVVPTTTSTRHVAAAAFYHCLVLGTKNLIRLEQPDTYGVISIDIV